MKSQRGWRHKLTAIVKELGELRQVIQTSKTDVDKKLEEMQEKIDTQSLIIWHQQMFLEKIDRKERENKLVLLGVADQNEAMEGATNDEDKIKKIWEAIGDSTEVHSHRRLGILDPSGTKRRPILLEVASITDRDAVLEKAKRMKTLGTPYDKIYIKKDTHPTVRQE
ncbi:hypothetical protein E2C01_058134 [Portunus trituberculatus]|uniref:Endonuclease-reverse transcriptase n=1 Tax=Portunus trituberculatus TaxID=210409 RepID=A0A5B7H587_PORTR|nr:hypothetical protein [Portunus trituberculatus]